MSRAKPQADTLADLKTHTGFWLRFVSNHVSHAFARELTAKGVTIAEWVVLREMYNRGETSPGVLADIIGLTRGAASKLIDRLVGKRLMTRQDRGDDRRFQDIGLTAAGRKLVPSLAALADRNDAEFLMPLSSGEREALLSILKKLAHAHGLRKLPID